MEDKQLNGICVLTRNRGDNDRMLSLFCSDGCVYDVLARGALKPKYKLKFASQLFSYCDYFLCPSKAGYYILSGATFGELSFLRISSDPEAFIAACLVCETAYKCVKSENKLMYAETVAALGELAEYETTRPDIVALRILMAAFVSSGYGTVSLGGEKGEICDKILAADKGKVSSVSADASAVRSLIKTYGTRFNNQFGYLNSLKIFL